MPQFAIGCDSPSEQLKGAIDDFVAQYQGSAQLVVDGTRYLVNFEADDQGHADKMTQSLREAKSCSVGV